jgi:ribosome maturation factor RimP
MGLIIKQVTDLIEPIIEDIGFELVDVEYLAKSGRWVLCVYIDKESGVTIDDCVQVSREIGDLIDIKSIIENEYSLEVSSPGVNRPLKKEVDFLKVVGKRIKVKMAVPVDGSRNFSGYLKGLEAQVVRIEVNGRLLTLPLDGIEKANLVYEF